MENMRGTTGEVMPRTSRTESATLLAEARAIEIYADDISVPPERLPEYWEVSTDLIMLMADIEEMNGRIEQPDENDPELLALRHRLRAIASRLADIDSP